MDAYAGCGGRLAPFGHPAAHICRERFDVHIVGTDERPYHLTDEADLGRATRQRYSVQRRQVESPAVVGMIHRIRESLRPIQLGCA